jgi:hypothetical protein
MRLETLKSDKFGRPWAEAHRICAGLDLGWFDLRLIRGVWVGTYRCRAMTVGRSRGVLINCYLAIKRDGSTTLGIYDSRREHIAAALES